MTKKEELLKQGRSKMKEVIEHMSKEFSHIRAGRASDALVNDIKVDCYGTSLNINQLATVSVPDARTIIISPWDKNVQENIYKALLKSPLSLTPIIDGEKIRITLPMLTKERKNELIKELKAKAEAKRVAIRNIRRDLMRIIKEEEKEGKISEDDGRLLQKEVQQLTDDFIKQIDKKLEDKEKEILEE